MDKLDQKFKKRSAHKFDDEDNDSLLSQRKEQRKHRRETRQRSAEHAGEPENGRPF